MKKHSHYIPAFHFHCLTRWYDPMMRLLFPEQALKTTLITKARLQPGQNILDIGCGTGTLTLLIKQTQPNATIYGLDIDRQVWILHEEKSNKRQSPSSCNRVQQLVYLI